MQQAGVAEAAVLADQTNVSAIQDAIASSTSPLGPAQAQLSADIVTFNSALQNVSQVALAAQLPVPSAPAPPASGDGSASGAAAAAVQLTRA
jgi:hypothetical protein